MEVTLQLFEIVAQHLHPGTLHGIEFPLSGLVALIIIGVVDSGRSGDCLSLALTNLFARLSILLKHKHGVGIWPS